MKSGTNQFRGSLFAFANTEATQARNSFASSTSVKPKTKYQQFGATLGGPIIKDKLFFFTDYQHTVDNLGQLRRVVIPPMEWRNGDFSTASTTIYDPATGNPDGTGRTPFPNNRIPADRLSPVAQGDPRQDARAQRRRRRLRAGQLRAGEQRAREDDQRLQREAELQPRR